MFRSVVSALGLGLLALSLAACDVSKSSHPLSPSVAGPIPGVNITVPKLIDPAVGSKIAVDKQPLTLMVENASTSGVRPISYLFEVATDAAFTNKVFVRDGVTPGADGRTSLRLPDALATGRTLPTGVRGHRMAPTPAIIRPSGNENMFTPIVIDAPSPGAGAECDAPPTIVRSSSSPTRRTPDRWAR